MGGQVRRFSACFAVFGFLIGTGLAGAEPEPVPKKVLLLHADNQFQPANMVMDQVFQKRLTGVRGIPITLYSEYFQSVTFPSARATDLEVALLKERYDTDAPDLVIVTDDTSWDFLVARKDTLFSGVPKVFCGITVGKIDPTNLPARTTGNFKRVDILGSLRNIRRIQPRVTDVVVVLGVSPQDRYYEEVTRKAFGDLGPGLKPTYLQGHALEEIERVVSTLPKTSAVLFVSLYQDGAGRTFNPRDALDELAPRSRVPVYGVSDTYLGHGIMGGNLVSFGDLSNNASDIVLQIFKGTRPEQIPAQVARNSDYFDWKVMSRWGIKDSDLPPGAIVLGEPPDPWVVYRGQILGIIGFIVLESILLVALFFQLSWRKRAQRALAAEVAERKKLADLLRAEKDQLDVTLQSIGDGVITTDTTGRVVLMNPEAETMTGWTSLEARDRSLAEVFPIIDEWSRKTLPDPALHVLETRKVQELSNHTVLVSKDGTERPIADSGAPIIDEQGTIKGVVLVFRDMTERHRLLDTIHKTDKMNSLGVLAGGIAHDFNNLIGGIVGYVQLARLQMDKWPGSDPKMIVDYLTKATQVVTRTKDLTRQLLTFSKGGEPVRKPGDLGVVIRTSGTFFMAGSNVFCDFLISPDLWACEIDENQIGQVLDNLLLNAKQAMPAGGTILVQARNLTQDGQAWVEVKVKDTGAGIPPEFLPRIFDPFFTTKKDGNGLGLATCYSILKKHGGWIEALSQPGEGTTFRFGLPASQNSVSPVLKPVPARHDGSGTLLIMDDEPFLKEILKTMLDHMGYKVLEAKDGEDALRILHRSESEGQFPKACIFDLTIPGAMGGKDLAAVVGKKWPGLPLFAASGYSDDQVLATPQAYGFTASLRKPFLYEELAATLDRYLKPAGSKGA